MSTYLWIASPHELPEGGWGRSLQTLTGSIPHLASLWSLYNPGYYDIESTNQVSLEMGRVRNFKNTRHIIVNHGVSVGFE